MWISLYFLLLWFQPVSYFWENGIIFSDSQPRLGTRKIDGGRKFLEIKVQKNMSSNVCNWLTFATISRKRPIVCENVKKIGYREFDYSGTLSVINV